MQTFLIIIIAVAFGIVFERYYFCMNSAITDTILISDTRKLKGLIAAVLASAILFNTLIGFELIKTTRWPLLPTAVFGGIFFGIGMNLAGGCVSGTLFKMGQGYIASFVAFIGIALGLGAVGGAMSFMPASSGGGAGGGAATGGGSKPFAATLPLMLEVNPLFFAGLAAVISGVIFFIWSRQSRKDKCQDVWITPESEKGTKLRIKTPNFIIGGILIAVLNTVFFIVKKEPLGLSGLMIYIPSQLAHLINDNWASQNWMFGRFLRMSSHVIMTVTGILFIAGAFLSAFMSGRFHLRFPIRRQAISGLIGGFLMGISIPLMWGCNATHILGNLPQFSIAGIISTLSIVFGAWLGTKITARLALHK